MATMKTIDDVLAWIESVDEQNTQQCEIQNDIEEAWLIVFGRDLDEEDDETQVSAWSHLCAAVL